jgi:hypothetical protein
VSIEVSKRDSVFCELKNYCHLASKNAYMEVTEWSNGEGFDIIIDSHHKEMFSLTHGEYQLLQVLINYKGARDEILSR